MADDPLTGAHRPIRRIAAPDVPVPGLLATDGDETVLLVDVDELDDALWLSADADHLWAVADVARRRGGHDAVLPWCSARLSAVLAARAGDPLSGGEAVTIAVSVLRGLRQARSAWGSAGAITGDWWLTDSGCPLVVRGDGGGIDEGALALLETTARACSDAVVASAVRRVPELITTPQPPDRLDAAERALFEVSAPRPLRTTTSTAAVFDDLRPQGARRLLLADDPPLIAAPGGSRTRIDRVAGLVGRAAERLRALTPVERGGRSDRPARERRSSPADPSGHAGRSRRGLVMIAGAAAMAVVTIGLLWPSSERPQSVAGAASPEVSTSPSTSGVGDDAPAGKATIAAPDVTTPPASDPVEIADGLLKRVADCRAADDECADVVADRAVLQRVPEPGPLALVDDYGGIAVLRAERSGGDVLVVIEQRDDRWRVRDAYATS